MLTHKEKGGNINLAAEIRRLLKAETGQDRTTEIQHENSPEMKLEKNNLKNIIKCVDKQRNM